MKFKNAIIKTTSIFLVVLTLLLVSTSAFAETSPNETNPADEPVTLSVQEEIVNVARSKIGFYEGNINEFTTWYYGYETDAFWCTIFVSWCADQVGALQTAVPKRSSCTPMKDWFERRGEYYPVDSDYIPVKGDIVFINTAVDNTDDIHHVEIITENGFFGSTNNPKIKCIGGNTSDLNFNGSEYVTEKTRPVNGSRAQIVGYAHPSYEKSQGLLGALITFADDNSPAFFTFLYSKFISILPKLQDFLSLLVIPSAPSEPTEPIAPVE